MTKSPDAFRTISEVAEWLGIQAHVLRFWESKFTQVKPVKRAGGRRYYRPSDMLLIGGIKKLLHDDGLTIKGVQKIIREQGVAHVSSLSQSLDEPAPPSVTISGTSTSVPDFSSPRSDPDASAPKQIDMDLSTPSNDDASVSEGVDDSDAVTATEPAMEISSVDALLAEENPSAEEDTDMAVPPAAAFSTSEDEIDQTASVREDVPEPAVTPESIASPESSDTNLSGEEDADLPPSDVPHSQPSLGADIPAFDESTITARPGPLTALVTLGTLDAALTAELRQIASTLRQISERRANLTTE